MNIERYIDIHSPIYGEDICIVYCSEYVVVDFYRGDTLVLSGKLYGAQNVS